MFVCFQGTQPGRPRFSRVNPMTALGSTRRRADSHAPGHEPVPASLLNARSLGGRVARAVVPGLRRVAAQVAPYARAWEESNGRSLDAVTADPDLQLWVALGDSTAQGIGASAFDQGYVGQVLGRLGDGWRVVNWSRSGAKVGELLADFVPRLDWLTVEPALVTCGIGANDLVPTPIDDLLARTRELVARLPAGAVVATLPQGLRPQRAMEVNEVIRAEAPAAGLRVADVWAHTGPPWRGRFASDGFHPNSIGYGNWAAAFTEALGLG